MAKKRVPAEQSRMFKRDIPQMPEGYYSSGPNPNLRRFVQEHATPYSPETDDYDVPPFDPPITTAKATAIYNMHTYWSKKPHDAIQQYIRHYTQPGDIVLDPMSMCGSGGTALAALMEGRAAIAIDLSPAATFITKNYCTPVNVDELQARVKPEMDWLYETGCDRCDGRATTGYPIPIRATVRDRVSEAQLLDASGRVRCGEVVYGSPSPAARAVTGWIACNGWIFWQYQDPKSGELHMIGQLRG